MENMAAAWGHERSVFHSRLLDLIWETSAASAAQFKNFPAGSESSIRKVANLASFMSLYKK